VSALRGVATRLARAVRGRLRGILGEAVTATAASIAIGVGSELAGYAVSEYQLQRLINDLPRAMDDLMKSIDTNKEMLNRITSAILRTRLEGALARFIARSAEIRGFRFAGNWFAGTLIMQQFSILVTEVWRAVWDTVLERFQRFALLDLKGLQFHHLNYIDVHNILRDWQEKDRIEISKENMLEFLDIQNDLNSVATFFDALGRTSALGAWLGFSALARVITNVSWSLGIGWLSWVAIGPGMRATIAAHLEKYYNKITRPNDVPREVVMNLWKRGMLSDEDTDERLALQGYPDEDIKLLKAYTSEYFSESQLDRAFKSGLIGEDEYREGLYRLGWRGETLEKRIELAKSDILVDLKSDLISEYEKSYVSGYRTLQDIENVRNMRLDTATPEGLRRQILSERAERELRDLQVKTYIENYMDGSIDEDTLRSQLSTIIVRPDYLEALVQNTKARREPKVKVEREETLEDRRRRLENRLEQLRLQIRHQEELRDAALSLIDVRIGRIMEDAESSVRRLEQLRDARIRALTAEYEAYKTATEDRIRARIREIETLTNIRVQEVLQELEARKKAIDEEVQAYISATEYDIDARIRELQEIAATQTGAVQQRTLIRIDFLEEIKSVPAVRRAMLAEVRKRRLEEEANIDIERIQETAKAQIAFLEEVSGLSVAEREARLNSWIDRIRTETDVRIAEIRENAERRVEELQAARQEQETRYRQRIERLTLEANQTVEELSLINEALQRLRG